MVACGKWLSAVAACGLFGCTAEPEFGRLPPAEPDAGGVTFDFEAISARRFATAFDGKDALAAERFEGRSEKAAGHLYELGTTNGGVWRVSARYKLHHAKSGRGICALVPCRREGRRTVDDPSGRGWLLVDRCDQWCSFSRTVEVKPGYGLLRVAFVPNGEGVVEFRDVTVKDETPQTPIVVRQMPEGNLDRRFCVGEGQAGVVEWTWRKTDAGAAYDNRGFRFTVTLPPGIDFLGCSYATTNSLKVVRNADGTTVATFGIRRWPPPQATFNSGDPIRVYVKATGAKGPCGTGRLRIAYDGRERKIAPFAAPAVDFEIVDAVRCAAKPKRYMNGLMCYRIFQDQDRTADGPVADLLADSGADWLLVCGYERLFQADLLRARGVRNVTALAWQLNDGFRVGQRNVMPASEKFMMLGADGRLEPHPEGTCPVTVYRESDFFRTNTVPYIRDCCRGSDGLWSNWEPGPFFGKGCYCDRCCREFAEWSKRPYGEVRASWPSCVRKGGAFAEEALGFRSWQHAGVVKTLAKYVARFSRGGADSPGFIPAIAWVEMSGWWRPRNYVPEVRAVDYAGSMKWMNPWGPYVAWESNEPWNSERRKPLVHFLAARDVRRTVDADYPLPNRPKLMALPQAYQCGGWLTQPERLGMAFDSYFFNRFEATSAYYFPRGYDARWFAAVARATERAARYEDFVWDGRPADDCVRVTPVGPFAPNVKHLSAYMPGYDDVPLLQFAAFEKDGATIVAVFNFWERGEAFFNLKVRGREGEFVILSENGELRSRDDGRARRMGRELSENGIDLVVGAARTKVFEIRRADAPGMRPKSVLTDGALRRLLEGVRERLEKAAAEDAETEKANGELTIDWMPVI